MPWSTEPQSTYPNSNRFRAHLLYAKDNPTPNPSTPPISRPNPTISMVVSHASGRMGQSATRIFQTRSGFGITISRKRSRAHLQPLEGVPVSVLRRVLEANPQRALALSKEVGSLTGTRES